MKIWHHILARQTKVVSAAVYSNVVVLLVLTHCLLLLPLFDGVFDVWSMSCYAVLSVQSSF